MKKLNTLALALLCTLPIVASAQTPSGMDKAPASVKPANTPTNEMERKSGTNAGTAKSGSDAMSGDTTDHSKMSDKKMKKGSTGKTATEPAAGDVPTYPAKTKDGRPTGDSTMSK